MPLALPSTSTGSSTTGRGSSSASGSLSPESSSAAPSSTSGSNLLASLSRTALFIWGMMLKRPSRLFRPSRISSITFLRALAKRDNLSLSPRGLYRLARTYGPWSLILPLIPPIVLNTTLTTLLFASHSGLVALLSRCDPFRPTHPLPVKANGETPSSDEEGEQRRWWQRDPHAIRHQTLLSAIAGFGAGVVQSTLAIPIEKGVKVVGRLISGSSNGRSSVVSASGASAAAPPPASGGRSKASGSASGRAAVRGKIRKDTLAWLRELRTSGVASSFSLTENGGWRRISKLGFEGWRWGAAKDGVGYAVFFLTFDTSRRLALHVRSLVSSLQSTAALHPKRTADRPRVRALFGLEDAPGATGIDEEEGGLGYEGSRWARTSQAVVLVAGGMLAGQLFLLSTRPFDAVLRLLSSPAHLPSSVPGSRNLTRAYIRSHLRHPLTPARRNPKYRTATLAASGKPLPALPLIIKTLRGKEGIGYFFQPAKSEGSASDPSPSSSVGGSRAWKTGNALRRLGWGLVKLGPWGGAFLAFAWAGGEV